MSCDCSTWLLFRRIMPKEFLTQSCFRIHSRNSSSIIASLREDCRWRALPHDFPPRQTVYNYFRCWRARGVGGAFLKKIVRADRRRKGRESEPSAAILDSQSVKSAGSGRGARLPRRQKDQGPLQRHVELRHGRALACGTGCLRRLGRSSEAGQTLAQAGKRFTESENRRC